MNDRMHVDYEKQTRTI